jgi:hypothetical protein
MAETAAHLVDHVVPRVPVRQWVLSFPIPLRLLFAAHPHLLFSVLQIVHRVIATFLIKQARLQRTEAKTGALNSYNDSPRWFPVRDFYLIHLHTGFTPKEPLQKSTI